jgi:hypothetical protein
MSSGEFEQILIRNSNFMSVRRAGSGDGFAGFHCALTGQFVLGIGGGYLPEYTYHKKPKYDCECTPGGLCRSGRHGTEMARGWRNVLFDLVCRGRVKATDEIHRILGDESTRDAIEKLFLKAPTVDPNPSWNHSSLVAP